VICWAAPMNPDRSGPTIVEMRALMGGSILNLPRERWLPRRRALQPMFSHAVTRYADTWPRLRKGSSTVGVTAPS
jgi:hypothetical protein